MAGIYIHIPFCASFCTYCGFYSEISNKRCSDGVTLVANYTDALIKEMHRTSFDYPISTVYFGGGTPSLLPVSCFEKIVTGLRHYYDLSGLDEFTVEVNPDDIAGDNGYKLIEIFKKCGVNRISMGIQSFFDEHLRWMNRRHTANEAHTAFRRLRTAGFQNISIDLIFGFSSLSIKQWMQNLESAILLAPEHISAYQMSLDPDSILTEMVSDGKYSEPSDHICAEQYELLQKYLTKAGYFQYEISSFAKGGYHSRHNSAYWAREPYLGLGAAAHSFDGNRIRKWNICDINAYCAGATPEHEYLSDANIYNERIMLGLRTANGIPASLLESEKAIAAGLEYNPMTKAFVIPREKYFICDTIIEKFIITENDSSGK